MEKRARGLPLARKRASRSGGKKMKPLAILQGAGGGEPLPLLHRCAILYLTAPALIWLVGWFEWWFGVPAALLVALALAPALRGGWRPRRPSPAALGIVALGFACTMLTAYGGFFDAHNGDWWDRRATLLDMSHHPWPVRVRDGLADFLPWGGGEREALLRYYLGWYMAPGLAGRLFGPAALNWAVPLWSGAGMALILLLFARGLAGWRTVLAAGIFVFFGGMDWLRSLILHGAESFHFAIDRLGWPGVDFKFPGLVGFRGKYTLYGALLEYFAWTTDFIAAAMYTLLLVHLRRHPRFVAAGGAVLAVAPFWSAWVALGLLPFVAVLLWENAVRRPAAIASWSNLCLAVPLAGLFAVYLSSGALDFSHGWLWEGHGWRDLLPWARKFYLSEFLTLLLFLLLLRPRLARNPLFVAMSATLLLLPLYRLGGGNLTSRGAAPALVLLSWFCARALLVPVAGVGGRVARTLRRLGGAGVVCCLGLGAVGPLTQLAMATRDDVALWYALSGLTTFAHAGFPMENLAPEVPPLLAAVLRAPSREGRETSRAAGEPVFRADFDIHVRGKKLVLVNERCGTDDPLLRVRFPNPDINTRIQWDTRLRRYGAGCGAVVGLPGWRVHSARVGLRPPDGDWAVEILLDEAGEAAGVSHPPRCAFHDGESGRRCPANPGVAALRAAYQRARAGAPAARARFDVYVDDQRITHVREPCVFGDMEARFFLHLAPADPADLPPARESSGFDNHDFAFGERGGLFDGKCVAISHTPYPLREVYTGQYTPAGPVWSVRAHLPEPSAGVREGPAPRMERAREGPAPRMEKAREGLRTEEPSAGMRPAPGMERAREGLRTEEPSAGMRPAPGMERAHGKAGR